MAEPETVYTESPKGLGETTRQDTDQKLDRQSSQQEEEQVERVPVDCGYSNKLAGAPLGPSNFGAGGTSDLRLLRRAIRERWPLGDELREQLPQWLDKIVGDSELVVRGRVGAAKVIVEMDKLNLDSEKHDASGGVQRVDLTSGGKPLGGDLKGLSDQELEQRLRALEGDEG